VSTESSTAAPVSAEEEEALSARYISKLLARENGQTSAFEEDYYSTFGVDDGHSAEQSEEDDDYRPSKGAAARRAGKRKTAADPPAGTFRRQVAWKPRKPSS